MSRGKVLIVNDSFSSRLLLAETCELVGIDVVHASDGKEALNIFENEDFDLVLMDIEMPVMNGYESTRNMRTKFHKPKCDVPIIAVTAHVQKYFSDEYHQVRFDYILEKPFMPDKLFELLDKYIPAK